MIKFFGKKDGDSLRKAYFVDDNNNKISGCIAVIGTIDDLLKRELITIVDWKDCKDSDYLAITVPDGKYIDVVETQKEAAQAVRDKFE